MGNEAGGGTQRIVLDLDPGVEPISGVIAVPSAPAQRFSGVMQLLAALEDIRDDAPAGDHNNRQGRNRG